MIGKSEDALVIGSEIMDRDEDSLGLGVLVLQFSLYVDPE